MKTKLFLLLAISSLSSMSFALNSQTPELATMKLSFTDFRAACLNPQKFHNQVPPKNIQISCKDTQTKWVPDSDGSMGMSNGRRVTASVISDKYSADPVTGGVTIASQVATCPKFKQVFETVETVRAVTCDDLVAFSGSAVEYCTGIINDLRALNPAAIVVSDAGQMTDLCNKNPGQKQ